MSSVATLSRGQQRRYFSLGSANAQAAMPMPGTVTVGAALTASVVDTLTVTEAIAAVQIFLANVNDAVTVSESLSVTQVFTVAATDTVTLSENVAYLLTILPGVISDTVTVSENVAAIQTMLANLVDTVTVTESVTNLRTVFASSTENVTVTEAIAAVQTFTASTSDSVTVTESSSVLLALFLGGLSDNVTLTESVANLLSQFGSVTDTVTVTDSPNSALLFDVATFDTITLSESTAFGLSMGFTIIDTVTVTDALTEPLTWTIRAGATALSGVKVWLSTADPYTASNLVRDSIKTTDASGQVSYDIEFNQIYFGWRDSRSHTFPDPFRFRYNTTTSRWEQWNGSAYVEWTP